MNIDEKWEKFREDWENIAGENVVPDAHLLQSGFYDLSLALDKLEKACGVDKD